MERLNHYFRPAAGLLILLVGYALLMPSVGRHTQASTTGNPIVTVGNTSTNPVPITGTTTITGNVGIAGTPNVNVTNVPNVNISNTPNVMLAGTPTVNLGNGSAVNVSDGTVQIKAILDNLPNVVVESGLNPGTTQDYQFPRTVNTSTLIISTFNDVDVGLSVNPPNGVQYAVPLGRIRPATGPLVINFVQPVPIQHVTVHNPDIVIHATFAISALGN